MNNILLNADPQSAQNRWQKALQSRIGLATKVRVSEFNTEKNLPDADEILVSKLSDEEMKYGFKFNSVLRRSQWAEGARHRLRLSDEFAEQKINKIQTSTSHSIQNSLCRVITVASGMSDILGIGVDLEPESREVKQEIRKKFLNKDEPTFERTTLELWCLKEAVWKSNPNRHETVLSQYPLTDYDSLSQCFKFSGPHGFNAKAWLLPMPLWIAAFSVHSLG